MTHPLHALKHEHRVIEKALRALDGVCARLQWGNHVPSEVLARLADFIRTFADRNHHGKEEIYLFPLLQKHGLVQNGGSLGALTREHQIENELSTEMHRAIEGYRGADPMARQHFIESASKYSRHLLSHIDKEDEIIIRLADELFDEKDLASLSAGFQLAESEFGAGAIEKYEGIASELERDWAL